MDNKIALAGNPNSGKTTLFNQLTGARAKIGNWSGTTVEKKEGELKHQGKELKIVDLPGTYSLSAYSIDERIARTFLLEEKPGLVVVIIDASNLERNLYLVSQLLELGQNVLLDLNMIDLVRKRGIKIYTEKLSKILRIPVVETVASEGKGIQEIKDKIIENLGNKSNTLKIDYGELEKFISSLEDFLEKRDGNIDLSKRALAIKILENDQDILKKLEHSDYFKEILEMYHSIEAKFSEDLETFIIEKRYAYLKGVVKECTDKSFTLEERITLSDKIDRIVTNRIGGIPIFLMFMYLLFSMVFKIGDPLVGLVDGFFGLLSEKASLLIEFLGLPPWFASFISDGVISGVGSVLVFLPYILLLFLGISFLEDTGYLARAAFIMDKVMHSLGLHGKSFIPMLLGFGCNIPGIMATRTLESNKDRILTILILPLMSCSARLPVYTLFAGALFPKNQGLVVFSLYILGIALSIIMAKLFKSLFFKGETTPLVMEIPPYRLPKLKNILLHMWSKSVIFIKKAGTIIFIAVIFIWALASLPVGVEYASEQSIVGRIGEFLAPVFKPAGFGFWQAAVALIFGILAKEVVVGTMGTLYGVGEEGLSSIIQQQFTPLSGYAFLLMILIYIPCIAALATIKRETNWKWTGIAVFYTFLLGWFLSVIVYQFGSLFIK